MFEICLVSVSTSDHKWLNFDSLKFRLENCVRNLLSTSEIGKIVNLIDFIEDCFYHLWSVVEKKKTPLIHSFLETLRTISDKNAPEMERGISKHDCFFYDNELRACKRKRRQLERIFRRTRSTIDRLHMEIATENFSNFLKKMLQVFGEETK